jgi:hypothetical protein
MIRLSPAAVLAWKIAMFEALLTGSKFLEKEHLLIGLFSLEKVINLDDLTRNVPIAQKILHERDILDLSLKKTHMDAAAFRRNVRRALPRGEKPANVKIIHRSSDCRKYFDRAVILANGNEIACIHLLNAILENPGPRILNILEPITNDGARQAAPVITMEMTQAIQKFRNDEEQKRHLQSDITMSRHSLETLSPGSSRSLRLRKEVWKKTIHVARLSLELHDLLSLTSALRDLIESAGDIKNQLLNLITQLDYMQNEGIGPGEDTKMKVLSALQSLEKIGPA